jgi:hypothetical protein
VSATAALNDERGQATPEWVGLVLLVSLLLVGALSGIGPLPLGVSLARSIGTKLICAIELYDSCDRDSALASAYGIDLARELREHAPTVFYERGMHALPVDFRSCREAACADAPDDGRRWRSDDDRQVTAFVHVIDCRRGAPPPPTGLARDCSGDRAGNLYLQYWFYYPESATLRDIPVVGSEGYHPDDWESYQVRIGGDGEDDARASSHNGYNYSQGVQDWGSDAGIGPLREVTEWAGLRNANGWGKEIGAVFVSGGSHAGNVKAFFPDYPRFTPSARLALVPLEPFASGKENAPHFAISPPWRKQVWRDGEAEGTG